MQLGWWMYHNNSIVTCPFVSVYARSVHSENWKARGQTSNSGRGWLEVRGSTSVKQRNQRTVAEPWSENGGTATKPEQEAHRLQSILSILCVISVLFHFCTVNFIDFIYLVISVIFKFFNNSYPQTCLSSFRSTRKTWCGDWSTTKR
jgi:hypothetical protein